MPPLTLMVKPVSGRCNMRCSYCFYAEELAQRGGEKLPAMTDACLEQLVRRAMQEAEGRLDLIFQGGEPMLAGKAFYRRLLALERSLPHPQLSIHHALQTNGLLLDEEWCDLLQEGNFLVGLSLDGTEALHDLHRRTVSGQGSWRQTLAAAALLRKRGVPYNILCVVTEPMAAQGRAVFQALREHGFLQFIPCLGSLSGERRLQSESYGRFLVDVFDCYERAFDQGRPVSIRTFDNWLAMARGLPPESCAMGGRCGRYYLVEADGSVYPCDFYAVVEWRLGSIREQSFARMARTEQARRFTEPLPLPEACRSCPWLLLCRGGCRRDRDLRLDGQLQPCQWCEGYRLFFEQCGARLQRLADRVYGS